MAEHSRLRQPGPAEGHHRQPVRPPESESALNGDEHLARALQRMAAGNERASAASVLRLQHSIGNRAVGRALSKRSATISRLAAPSSAVQRALLAKLTAEPAYSDGLTLATIKSTALSKPARPKKEGADWTGKLNADARKVFKNIGITDQALFDANLGDARLLQPGELHGNELYKNKSGDLPAGTTYVEYDTALYQGDPRLRGNERVVTGADGKNYYTANHYTDFAEF